MRHIGGEWGIRSDNKNGEMTKRETRPPMLKDSIDGEGDREERKRQWRGQ